jgi:heterotetrameric sarcosine oxidase gamma subunit
MAEVTAQAAIQILTSPCEILQVDSWNGSMPALEANLSRQLGCEIPTRTSDVIGSDNFQIIRISPYRFWLIGGRNSLSSPDENLCTTLWLGEGRIRWSLSGEGLLDKLSQFLAIDWEDEDSASGRAISTSFHRVPVVVLPQTPRRCEIIVPRSFEESLRHLLLSVISR